MTPLEILLLVSLVALATALAFLGLYVLRVRARLKQKGLFGAPWPIPRVKPADIDPVFTPGPFGPTLAAEIRFVGNVDVPGGASDLESWVLAGLAKGAREIFEFGTCTGRTTYHLAINSPAGAKVTTLTLGPNQHASYKAGPEDDEPETRMALVESSNTKFLYNGSEAESKITQLFGDSKAFDPKPWQDKCDLVFVDGSHAYSYVVSDTEMALQMVKPGGLVLWHDYRGPRRIKGVWKALNELASKGLDLKHVKDTSLIVWRRPLIP